MNFQTRWQEVGQMEGFLSQSEGRFLYNTARGLPSGAKIVEIGSYKGKSTSLLGLALQDAGNTTARIYAIDPFVGSSEHDENSTYDEFLNNIRSVNVEAMIEVNRGESEKIWHDWPIDRRIDFLWVDGAHEYELVSLDFGLWYRYLKPGGIIAAHDAGGFRSSGSFAGVRKAVCEYFFGKLILNDIGTVGSIIHARKTHKLDGRMIFRNMLSRYSWWYGVDNMGTRNILRALGRHIRYVKKSIL